MVSTLRQDREQRNKKKETSHRSHTVCTAHQLYNIVHICKVLLGITAVYTSIYGKTERFTHFSMEASSFILTFFFYYLTFGMFPWSDASLHLSTVIVIAAVYCSPTPSNLSARDWKMERKPNSIFSLLYGKKCTLIQTHHAFHTHTSYVIPLQMWNIFCMSYTLECTGNARWVAGRNGIGVYSKSIGVESHLKTNRMSYRLRIITVLFFLFPFYVHWMRVFLFTGFSILFCSDATNSIPP